MSYDLYTPHPTVKQLKARRAECVQFALAMHRRILRAHPSDTSVSDWARARRYWIEQAYHAHGELLARLACTAWVVDMEIDGREAVYQAFGATSADAKFFAANAAQKDHPHARVIITYHAERDTF